MTAATAMTSLTVNEAEAASAKSAPLALGRDMPFDENWLFHRGSAQGLEQPKLEDASWRRVDLPHDWSIEDIPGGKAPDQLGPFDKNSIGKTATGFTVGGEGWYRKHFSVQWFPADTRVEIVFDGAYYEAEAWLNGHPLGRSVHGYIPFTFDLTPHLERGGDNVIAVRVRNLGRNSRWYSGSGLYRQVRLDVIPAGARLARWGTAAWTKRLSNGQAEVAVTTRVEESGPGVELLTRLRDSAGKIVAESAAAAAAEVQQVLVVRGPRLWSPDHPDLYTLESELRQGRRTVDRTEQHFGIRIVTFDPAQGMSINGTPTKLRGGSVHHDNGLLGARAFADADERRIRLLKARGFNAIRSAHNPASRTLREACDRLGMLLIDEAFDAWHVHKEPQDFAADFAEHWEEVIRGLVLPARNSPSVIMWSIGNEIPGRATDEGVRWAWTLANTVKRLDQSRPVTAGLNGVLGQEMIADPQTARPGSAGKAESASTIFIDVPGYNYRLEEMQREFPRHPERLVYASETFPKNVFDYAEIMRRTPLFLGEFVWTAMDYLGEAGVGATAFLKKGGIPYYFAGWPWVNAWCGDIDLTGRQKPQSLARDVAWGLSPVEVMVARPVPEGSFEWVSSWGWPDELPSWTWPGQEGRQVKVRVYTSGDRVELLLNGSKVAEKSVSAADKMHVELTVHYQPGKLEAVAYRGSALLGRRTLETAGAARSLHLIAERPVVRADRHSLAYVQVEVLDAQKRRLPEEERRVTVEIDGPAELAAFGNAGQFAVGSPNDMESSTFRGSALAILRSTGKPGVVTLTARTQGLPAASSRVRFS